MASGKPREIPADQAFKHFAKAGIMVRDFERDKRGEIKTTKVKGDDGVERSVRNPVTRELTESDILAARDYGNLVVAVTIDGRRYEAKSNGKEASA